MSLCRLVFLLFFVFNFVHGSHWRFGQISWKLISGTTVEFTAQLGWRSDFIGSEYFLFGDGSGTVLSDRECPSSGVVPCPDDGTIPARGNSTNITVSDIVYYELLSITTDISGAEAALIKYIFYHEYPSLSTYTYGFSSCCRVSGLEVGSNDPYIYFGNVALSGGNTGSPVSGLSPILQFPNGVSTTFDLSPIDNDGDHVLCRKALSSESGISINDDNNNNNNNNTNGTNSTSGSSGSSTDFYTVDETACTVTIGELANVGSKWAVQIIMETEAGDVVPIDFVFEATDPTLEAPVCNLITTPDNGDDGSYVVNVGDTLIVEMEGSDGDDTNLNVQSVTLPNGASISPTGSNSVPVAIFLTWTPVDGQEGSFSG